MKYNFFATILLAVLLLELIVFINPLFGALAYFAAIILALLIASKLDFMLENKKQIILIIAGIAAIKTTGLFLPLNFFWRAVTSYLMLTFLALYYAFGLNNPKQEIKVKTVLWAASVSILLGYAGMIITGLENSLMIFIIPLIAFSEEYIFRGILFAPAQNEQGKFAAVLFTSLLFGIFTISLGIFAALFFFTMSLVFSLFYIKTRSILFVIVLNAIVHVFLFAGGIQ